MAHSFLPARTRHPIRIEVYGKIMSRDCLEFQNCKVYVFEQRRRPFDEARLFCFRPASSAPGRDSITSEVDGHGAPDGMLPAEINAWGANMAVGTVKFFNTAKGYGFISPEGGGKDVFVHATAVEAAGMRTLNEGQRVAFDIQPDARGAKAVNIRAS
jgi:CspA family cold shock protein